MRYATPLPRTSLAKFTACLARPGHSRRSTHRAAHCTRHSQRAPHVKQAARRTRTPQREGLRLWVLRARRQADVRPHGRGFPLARAPARTSCPLHGARPRRLLPASSPAPPPATSFQPCAAVLGHSRPLPVKRRRTVLIPPPPLPPTQPPPPPPPPSSPP